MGRPVVSPSPAASGALGRRALYVLLALLLSRRGASGEMCRRWLKGHPVPVEMFACPRKTDGADAWLCCGTCTSPYCCSSLQGRLDQLPCFSADRPGTPTPYGTPAPYYTQLEFFLMLLLVAFTFSLYFGCCLWVNYGPLDCWVGSCRKRQDPPSIAATALHPVSSEDPSRPDPLDLHSPYSSCEMLLPPSSEEDSQRD